MTLISLDSSYDDETRDTLVRSLQRTFSKLKIDLFIIFACSFVLLKDASNFNRKPNLCQKTFNALGLIENRVSLERLRGHLPLNAPEKTSCALKTFLFENLRDISIYSLTYLL